MTGKKEGDLCLGIDFGDKHYYIFLDYIFLKANNYTKVYSLTERKIAIWSNEDTKKDTVICSSTVVNLGL